MARLIEINAPGGVDMFGQLSSLLSGSYSGLGASPTTSSGLGNNNMRAMAVSFTKQVTLTRLGAECTVIGDVGSVIRLGIYKDNGFHYPGDLLIDAGTLATDSTGVKEITISQVLIPGIYWMAGVIQGAATTVPTMRTISGVLAAGVSPSASTVSQNAVNSVIQSTITGALPSTFQTTPANSLLCARIFWKIL